MHDVSALPLLLRMLLLVSVVAAFVGLPCLSHVDGDNEALHLLLAGEESSETKISGLDFDFEYVAAVKVCNVSTPADYRHTVADDSLGGPTAVASGFSERGPPLV